MIGVVSVLLAFAAGTSLGFTLGRFFERTTIPFFGMADGSEVP